MRMNILCFLCLVWLSCVPEHGEEVACGAGDNEEMPDKMVVTDSLGGKEREATGVRDPAR